MSWFAYRVYAVTGRNKLIGGLLALFVFVQGCQSIISVVWIALHPRKFRRFDHFCVDLSVPSATVARGKVGCVRDLYLQTVEIRRTHVLPPHDCVRYALAFRPSASFHPEGLICIESWRRRYCCVLDHSDHRQENACGWISWHAHYLRRRCT